MDGLFVGVPLAIKILVPVLALSFMALEWGTAKLLDHHDTHNPNEIAASLTIAVLHKLVLRPLEAVLIAVPFVWVYNNRLFDIDLTSPLAITALFLAVEFIYYWQHRAAHHIRWFWAAHSVHHSPTRLNYTSGVRLSWFGVLSGMPLFFLPLIFLGFHPLAVVGTLAANLFYQFFIHTELSPKLGPLEWVLNTPGHHQVHHASNGECLDKNFGGVLIIFDRLFGTFAGPPKTEPIRYGLVGTPVSYNPFWINGRIWLGIARDVAAAESWSERFKAMFGRP